MIRTVVKGHKITIIITIPPIFVLITSKGSSVISRGFAELRLRRTDSGHFVNANETRFYCEYNKCKLNFLCLKGGRAQSFGDAEILGQLHCHLNRR